MNHTTIAAIATPMGTGGVSIIRVSGEDAVTIAGRVFHAKSGKKLENAKSHTLHYGFIKTDEGNVLDEVLVSVMRAPNTFTRENVVEINCHGGMVVTESVLALLLKNGAHLAAPGEFTKRAFLNGRLDLSQAEAVIDMINSPSSLALSSAANQLGGALSEEINSLRDTVLIALSKINANIDYPEEDIDEYETDELVLDLKTVREEIQKLLSTASRGRLIRDGIDTVICGKPNVGKSSVLNLLARDSRAIVTDIAGTTRDVIEERITLNDVVLNVFDTAGIRETDDKIESLGIDKSKEYIEKAELVLFVVDGSKPLDKEDKELFELLKEKPVIVLLNKADLGIEHVDSFKDFDTVTLSAKTGEGLDALSCLIEEKFKLGALTAENKNVITSLRHKEALSHAATSLSKAYDALISGMPHDMVSIDLTDCAMHLGEITGKTVSEEIVEKIFAQFCLGK